MCLCMDSGRDISHVSSLLIREIQGSGKGFVAAAWAGSGNWRMCGTVQYGSIVGWGVWWGMGGEVAVYLFRFTPVLLFSLYIHFLFFSVYLFLYLFIFRSSIYLFINIVSIC